MSARLERGVAAFGALAGLAGVALSAAAAHVSGPGSLDVAARFLLFHAPVFLAVAALLRSGLLGRAVAAPAALGLALGLALFSGDLSWRVWTGAALVPFAAPAGGVLLLLGWAGLGVAAVVGEP